MEFFKKKKKFVPRRMFPENARTDHRNVLYAEKKHRLNVYQFYSEFYPGLEINGRLRQTEFTGDYQGCVMQDRFIPKGIPLSVAMATDRRGWDMMERPSPFRTISSWYDIYAPRPMLWYLKPLPKVSRYRYNYRPGTRFVSTKHLKDLLSGLRRVDRKSTLLDITWKLEKQRDLMEYFGKVNFSRTFNKFVRSIKLRRRTEKDPNDPKLKEWLRYRKKIKYLKEKFNTWENWKDKVGYYDQKVMLKNKDYAAIRWDILISLQESYQSKTTKDRLTGLSFLRTMPTHRRDEVTFGKITQLKTRRMILENINYFQQKMFKKNSMPWKMYSTFGHEASWGFRISPRVYNEDQSRILHRQNMHDSKTMKVSLSEIVKAQRRNAHWKALDRQKELDERAAKSGKVSKEFTYRFWDSEEWRWPELKPANLFNWKATDDEKVTREHDRWKMDTWTSPEEVQWWEWEDDREDYADIVQGAPEEYRVSYDEFWDTGDLNIKRYRSMNLGRHWRWANPYWWGNHRFTTDYFTKWLEITKPEKTGRTKLKNPNSDDVFWFKFSHVEKIWLHRADARAVQYRNVGDVNGDEYRFYEKYFDRVWDRTYNLLYHLSRGNKKLLQREMYSTSGQKILKHKYSNPLKGAQNPMLRYYTYDGPNFYATNWRYLNNPDSGVLKCTRPKYLGPWHIPEKVRNYLEYEAIAADLCCMVRGSWWIPGLSLKYFIPLSYNFTMFFMIFFTIIFFIMYFFWAKPEVGDKRWKFGYTIPEWYTKGWASYVKGKKPGEKHTGVKKWRDDPTGRAPARHKFNWFMFNIMNIPICILFLPVFEDFCRVFSYTNFMMYLMFFSSVAFSLIVRIGFIELLKFINEWSKLQLSSAEYDLMWQEELLKTQHAEQRNLHMKAKALKMAGLDHNPDHIDDFKFKSEEPSWFSKEFTRELAEKRKKIKEEKESIKNSKKKKNDDSDTDDG